MIKPEEMADEIDRKRHSLDGRRREALLGRFKLFLVRESAMGEDSHPAAVALQAIEAGDTTAAVQYLDTEIERTKSARAGTDDEVTRAKLDVRQSDLERWKQNLV